MTSQLATSLFKFSELFAFPYEQEFKSAVASQFATDNWSLCIGVIIAYLVVIFGGREIMKSREPFDLQTPLAIWNAALSLFSFIGMCRTVPHLLGLLLSKEYEFTVCDNGRNTWSNGPTGLWVMLFIYSKVPELVDTVFIVLRKKPLIFLHWYHHITVVLFCWNSYSTMAGSGLYFVSMNYTVHALMYGYYCLQALNACPKSFPAYLITIAQILQMFIGTGVCISCWYYAVKEIPCYNDKTNLVAGAVMYASYLYLFVEFALKKYLGKGKGKKEKKIE